MNPRCYTLSAVEDDQYYRMTFDDILLHTLADEDEPAFFNRLLLFAKTEPNAVDAFNTRAAAFIDSLPEASRQFMKTENIAFRFNVATGNGKKPKGWGHTDLFDGQNYKLCQGRTFEEIQTFLLNYSLPDTEKIGRFERNLQELIETTHYSGKLKSERGLGPDFRKSTNLYALYERNEDFGNVRITMTGNRKHDERLANEIMRLDRTPKQHTWHHLDDLDPLTHACTMQLVTWAAHKGGHGGSVELWCKLFGITYK